MYRALHAKAREWLWHFHEAWQPCKVQWMRPKSFNEIQSRENHFTGQGRPDRGPFQREDVGCRGGGLHAYQRFPRQISTKGKGGGVSEVVVYLLYPAAETESQRVCGGGRECN